MREKSSIFGNGKFYKSALAIAVPIMLQQLIQSMVSLIDNFMVSGLGDISMSGVNVAGQILFVFMVFVNTICMSGGIFLTQFFGAKDKAGMQQAFMFKVLVSFAAMIPYLLVCIVYPREVLSLMVIGNTQADLILDEAVKYMRIMSMIGVPMTLSVCIASSLRDMGKVKIPLVVTIIATLANTVLNYLLIYGHLGLPALGVRGAALATVIARTIEFIIFAAIYIKTIPDFAIRFGREFRIDGQLFREVLKKGALMLFCEMTWVLSETITTAIYNGRGGADVVSGMASSFAIANLFFIAFGGIYSATSVIIGKTLGEGDLKKARAEKTWLLSGSFVFGIFMTFVGFATTLIVPVVFGKLSPSAIAISRNMVILMSFFMPVWVFINAQQAVARSGGDTKMGAYADAGITIVVMLPMLFILGRYTDIGPVQMYLCVKILDIIKMGIFHLWLKKERWLNNLTVAHSVTEPANAS
ncbi:putative efflux protein, MATE family [Butyrivibrio fibrisolvens DSM 3071]|uniref:Probable multidrug resistance protein NorM n=1 Tax=Butyrivibrio fibrisolvens DSM 3071 TaxID=1121131 RepID=A0A1M5UYA6_BUTFI|nr:MATE family efflux transporter [Butyrivibrio fibrisolvens]SHH67874.1 putative efflux protein, MATE family [Butyrivibrio fibrisolvens DSM 3071]